MEKKTDWLLIMVLLILLLAILVFVIYVKSSGSQCVKNPFIYGVKMAKASNEDKGELTCSCSFEKPNTGVLIFNSTAAMMKHNVEYEEGYNELDFNLSKIIRRE